MSVHPDQEVVVDQDGVQRFRENRVVRYLLDVASVDLNDLANIPFAVEDLEQFHQLIGYTLCGYGDLSFVREETLERVDRLADCKPIIYTLNNKREVVILGPASIKTNGPVVITLANPNENARIEVVSEHRSFKRRKPALSAETE